MFPFRKILRQDQNNRVFLPNTSKGKKNSRTRGNRGRYTDSRFKRFRIRDSSLWSSATVAFLKKNRKIERRFLSRTASRMFPMTQEMFSFLLSRRLHSRGVLKILSAAF